MVSALLQGFTSLGLLFISSWCIGEGGEILGEKYDASVVGGLVIAWLNTAPETIFFLTALETNNPNFAIGAMSGSVIVVTTVALGACICLGASARKSRTISIVPSVAKQSMILLSTVLVTLITPAVGGFSIMAGLLGVAGYAAFLWVSLSGKSTPMQHSEPLEGALEAGADADHHSHHRGGGDSSDDEGSDGSDGEEAPVAKGVLYLLCGGFLIIMYSDDFIDATVELASSLKLSPTLLAFFLAPVASEAPEILEAIQLSKNGNNQNINVAFSNMIGGTISKTTLLFAIFNFYGVSRGFVFEQPNYTVSILLLSLCAAAAGATGCIRSEKIPLSRGILFFALFVFTGIVQYYTTSAYILK
jgi:cation:H+ antiporter